MEILCDLTEERVDEHEAETGLTADGVGLKLLTDCI